jgi:hypothetical protein
MKLNAQQEELIAQFYFDRYIEDSMEYCERQLPGFIEYVGKEKLNQIVRAIVAKAETFGFDQRGSIWCYMDMVWQFGWDCEHDPQYPWIQQSRDQPKASDQFIRVDELYCQLWQWREATRGPQSQYWSAALDRLLRAPLLELPVRESHFETDMLACLKNLYARRYEVAGEEAMRTLVRRGRETAQDIFHFRSVAPQALVVLIAFTWGHAFMYHPMFEWAHPDESLVTHDSERRTAQRLVDGFRLELQDELTYLMDGRLNPRQAA